MGDNRNLHKGWLGNSVWSDEESSPRNHRLSCANTFLSPSLRIIIPYPEVGTSKLLFLGAVSRASLFLQRWNKIAPALVSKSYSLVALFFAKKKAMNQQNEYKWFN